MKRALILVMLFLVLTGCGSSVTQTEIRPDMAVRQKEVLERSTAYMETLLNAEPGSATDRISGFVHPEYSLNPNNALRQIRELSGRPDQSLRMESAAVKEILINGDTATVEMEVRLLRQIGAQTSLDSGVWQGMLREENGEWLVVSDRFQFQPSPSLDLSALTPDREYSIEELLPYLNLFRGEAGTPENKAPGVPSQPAATADSPLQSPGQKGKQTRSPKEEPPKHQGQTMGSAEKRAGTKPAVAKAGDVVPEGAKSAPEPLVPAETELVILYRNVPVPLSTSSGLVRAIGFPDRLYFDEEQQALILEYPGLKAAVKGQVLASLEITSPAGGAQLKEGIKAGDSLAGLVAKYGQPKEKKGPHYLYSFQNAELMPVLAGDTIERMLVVPRILAAPDPRDAFLRITNASQSEVYNRTYRNACSACHGVYLEGGKGPALNRIGSKLALDEISRVIAEGKGTMPPSEMEQSEIDALALWLYLQK